MIPLGNTPPRVGHDALERQNLFRGASKWSNTLPPDMMDAHLQDMNKRHQESLRDTREAIDSSHAVSENLSTQLSESWSAIHELENSIIHLERSRSGPSRVKRIRDWTVETRRLLADRCRRGSEYVGSMSPTSRMCLLAVALMALLASIWQIMLQIRVYRPFSLVVPG